MKEKVDALEKFENKVLTYCGLMMASIIGYLAFTII